MEKPNKDNSNKQPINVTGGLRATVRDDRDFSFGAVFSYAKLEDIPDTYFLEPLEIKDQKDTDMCTGYAACAASEPQEGIPLDPGYTFSRTKKIMGQWQGWGGQLRETAQSLVEYGSLEAKLSPFDPLERDKVANWDNWDPKYDELAKEHKKRAYFWLDDQNGYDMFDKIRGAMTTFRDEKRAILTGVMWHNDWTGQAYIKTAVNPGFGHAIAIIGWIKKDGVDYLAIQNSYGKSMGENGIQYFSRDIINRFFTFGAVMFADMPESKAVIRFKSRWLRNGLINAITQQLKDAIAKFSLLFRDILKSWS